MKNRTRRANVNLLDCIVIGGGQSGLYTARRLQELGLEYLLLERDKVGESWRKRPKDMKLFTSRQFCSLPGLTFAGDQSDFPDAVEVANYLEAYAQTFQLNVKENMCVERVTEMNSSFQVKIANGETYLAKSLINATGSNQQCIIPDFATQLSNKVLQFTAENLELNAIGPGATVVVVGSGASGRQIAGKLAKRCSKAVLACGKKRGLPPNTLFGVDLFWWLNKLGVLFADKHGLVAKILKKRNPVPCAEVNDKNLEKLGVQLRGRVLNCEGSSLQFADGASIEADAVIWAIGYRDDISWLQIPNTTGNGEFLENYGVAPKPGLFVVGRKWLSCRASELIMGVEKDVNLVVNKLEKFLNIQR